MRSDPWSWNVLRSQSTAMLGCVYYRVCMACESLREASRPCSPRKSGTLVQRTAMPQAEQCYMYTRRVFTDRRALEHARACCVRSVSQLACKTDIWNPPRSYSSKPLDSGDGPEARPLGCLCRENWALSESHGRILLFGSPLSGAVKSKHSPALLIVIACGEAVG